MRAKEVPGVTNVFFSLFKGHLFSDGIGLVSHWVRLESDGDCGAYQGSGGRQWGSGVSLP